MTEVLHYHFIKQLVIAHMSHFACRPLKIIFINPPHGELITQFFHQIILNPLANEKTWDRSSHCCYNHNLVLIKAAFSWDLWLQWLK